MSDETKVTSIEEWKSTSSEGSGPEPLLLPSGKTALVQRPGVEAFLRQGVIPNSMLAIIKQFMDPKAQAKSKSKNQEDASDVFAEEIMDDPKKLVEMFDLVDAITIYAVVQPVVLPKPADNEERDDDKLYIDEVDLEDKMFIFNAALGGVRDLEQFRKESEGVMGRVAGGKGLRGKAK